MGDLLKVIVAAVGGLVEFLLLGNAQRAQTRQAVREHMPSEKTPTALVLKPDDPELDRELLGPQ